MQPKFTDQTVLVDSKEKNISTAVNDTQTAPKILSPSFPSSAAPATTEWLNKKNENATVPTAVVDDSCESAGVIDEDSIAKEGNDMYVNPLVDPENIVALVNAYQHDLQVFRDEKNKLLNEKNRLEDELLVLQDLMAANNTLQHGTPPEEVEQNQTRSDAEFQLQATIDAQAKKIDHLWAAKQKLLEFAIVQGSLDQSLEQQVELYKKNQTRLLEEKVRLKEQLDRLNTFSNTQVELYATEKKTSEALRQKLANVTAIVSEKLATVEAQAAEIVRLREAKQKLLDYSIVHAMPPTNANMTRDITAELSTLRQERTKLQNELSLSEKAVFDLQNKVYAVQNSYEREQAENRNLRQQFFNQTAKISSLLEEKKELVKVRDELSKTVSEKMSGKGDER